MIKKFLEWYHSYDYHTYAYTSKLDPYPVKRNKIGFPLLVITLNTVVFGWLYYWAFYIMGGPGH